VVFGPQADYSDWATATCRPILVSTFADRGCRLVSAANSPWSTPIRFKYSHQHPILKLPQSISSLNAIDQVSRPYTTTGRMSLLWLPEMIAGKSPSLWATSRERLRIILWRVWPKATIVSGIRLATIVTCSQPYPGNGCPIPRTTTLSWIRSRLSIVALHGCLATVVECFPLG
jgi:hypothetical protein